MSTRPEGGRRRVEARVAGVVQGVGFRPFVHRLATTLGLAGNVSNGPDGVAIDIEGDGTAVEEFLARLASDRPPRSRIDGLAVAEALPTGATTFRIGQSAGGPGRPPIPPDLATCPACAAEVDDPTARRHRYPFTNCTDCGPRLSIVADLPYDRARTSMAAFPMCSDCRAEYEDPADRRFHAEPIACPACGPRLTLLDRAATDDPLAAAIAALRSGGIVAVKGLGGFQLLVDATDEEAVVRLRRRKGRPGKPMAVLVGDLEAAARVARLDDIEADALASPAGPIVLLGRRTDDRSIAPSVAPGNPRIGILLPTTPLHRLLAAGVRRPLVATSGNRSGEPMATTDDEARQTLGRVADLILTHDRPIVRPVDDSVAIGGPRGLEVVRAARGLVPDAIDTGVDLPTILALGGHLKCAPALGLGRRIVLGPHVGDLGSPAAAAALERAADDLVAFHRATVEAVACDRHPDYASTRLAEALAARLGVPLVRVGHHRAHLAAIAVEHGLSGPLLGLTFDGTGDGGDGTIWGGEALVADGRAWRRAGHLLPFRLPGGEKAVIEPRRAAAGVLAALGRPIEGFDPPASAILTSMMRRRLNAPATSSLGRLFDAVAALLGLRAVNEFEGQAAIELEAAAGRATGRPLPLAFADGPPIVADWRPALAALLDERDGGAPVDVLAARFHATVVEIARGLAGRVGLATVALTGGCFVNRILAARVRAALEGDGFEVVSHRRLPTGDGGLAVGQVAVAAVELT